ncbi:MAG: hypothetical protein AAFO01_19445, partial [Pseudomonadota bacterium]
MNKDVPSAKPLLDDCFAHDLRRMPAREALGMLRERISTVVSQEIVPLEQAYGRFLAEALIADRDVPAFTNVAVDGYAFAHQSLVAGGESRLRLAAGRSAAGQPFPGVVQRDEAV